jgi:AAA+ superfamily predicted ATPase
MPFGMGKSNTKVYVKSSERIKFPDVAGEDDAKKDLTDVVDYLHNPIALTEQKTAYEAKKVSLAVLFCFWEDENSQSG